MTDRFWENIVKKIYCFSSEFLALMTVGSVIGGHYSRPWHNKLIIVVSLMSVVGYDNKT